MKYKIITRDFYSHKYNEESKLYESIKETKYGAKRKGTIFGFWHEVGDWMMDMQGNTYCSEDWFTSREQCESYLRCWHIETYSEKEPLEIIN